MPISVALRTARPKGSLRYVLCSASAADDGGCSISTIEHRIAPSPTVA
jgi:hypothetical protein